MSTQITPGHDLSDDIVIGADAIAAFVGLTRRQVYGCVARGTMPIFKIGALVCARRSSILLWIEEQERDKSSAGEPPALDI